MIQGRVHSMESFGSADGPGIRFLVFLSGCNLRCAYCHNPDTWARTDLAQWMTADEILAKALRYRAFWEDEGGLTVSGGEPLLQLDFLLELFTKAREQGVHTCLDTAAGPFTRLEPWFSRFNALLQVTDLILLDIKHIDSAAHRALTGQGNEAILDCARYLSAIGQPVWIRHVLVPGINTDEASQQRLAAFLKTLTNVRRVEVLPYHTLGVFKWEALQIPYRLQNVPPPTDEQLAQAKRILGAN